MLYSRKELFDESKKLGELDSKQRLKNPTVALSVSHLKTIKLNLFSLLSKHRKKFLCCSKSQEDQLLLRGLDKYKNQIQLIEFFKKYRELCESQTILMSPDQLFKV